MNLCKYFFIISYLTIFSISLFSQNYSIFSCGEAKDINQKIYITKFNNLLSPFHSVELWPYKNKRDTVNMVVEIPKGSQDKMEINKYEKYNPLMYDIKDDKIRKITYIAKNTNISGYPFHYGALPKTWEHSGKLDPHINKYGDNDPVDIFDISPIPSKPGRINKIKILGAIAMIDGEEADWKLIGININDPNSYKYNDLADVPKNILETIHDFLLNYKTLEGKPQNKFYEKQFWNKKEAIKIVKELHENWQDLCNKYNLTKKIIETNRPDKINELPRCIDRSSP